MLDLITTTVSTDLAVQAIAEGGLIDWFRDLTNDTVTLIHGLVILVALIAVLYLTIKAKFTLISIVGSVLAAGILTAGVLNIGAIADMVKRDVDQTPPPGNSAPAHDADQSGRAI